MRIPHEFYPTPPAAVRALLSVERFDGGIWEPACGDGAIAEELLQHGYTVFATDKYDHGYGLPNRDFLKNAEPPTGSVNIVTNPPYGRGLADQFIGQALRHIRCSGGKAAMLLNLAGLSHPIRTPRWKKSKPKAVYFTDSIVCWPRNGYGDPPRYFTKHRYAWVVWDARHDGPTTADWLSAHDFRHSRSLAGGTS